MIAQIAEKVKASLSVGDLEKLLLDEKKKAAEPSESSQDRKKGEDLD